MITMMFAAFLSLLLGSVFLVSAGTKLRNPRGFVLAVMEYHVLPPTAVTMYARLVPPLEMVVALLVLSGTAVELAALCMAVFLLTFMAAAGVAIAQGRDLDCHCFGPRTRRRVGPGLLAQDSLLLAAAIALSVIVSPSGWLVPWAPARLLAGPHGPSATAITIAMSIGCVGVTLSMQMLLTRRTSRTGGWSGRAAKKSTRWAAPSTTTAEIVK
jgi:hypothetical protein